MNLIKLNNNVETDLQDKQVLLWLNRARWIAHNLTYSNDYP
ncbi:hypothetical protein [Legionella impletisoli]|nr:hypothetical protein [Legionella impletisoli]